MNGKPVSGDIVPVVVAGLVILFFGDLLLAVVVNSRHTLLFVRRGAASDV